MKITKNLGEGGDDTPSKITYFVFFRPFGSFALVITCLEGQIGINCPSAFLKVLKLPVWNESNFKIFKKREIDLSKKLPESNVVSS